MKKNRQFEYDDDLEMIDLLNDHFESAQKGIRDSARKEEKRKADKKKDDKAVRILTVLFIVSLCFSAFLVFLVERGKSRLKEEKAARAEEQKRYEQELEADWIEIDRLKSEMFTEQQLEERVAQRLGDIEEKAADEREDAVRQIMREAALKEGGGPMTAVRAVFDDEVFYTVSKDVYEFAPILDEIPKNDIKDGELVKDDDGTMHYMVDGADAGIPMIDVSEYQGDIDWKKVAASGIRYAILRAGFRGYGSGKLVVDKKFDANIKGATAAGIKVGAYFFSQAVTEEEAREEARTAVEHLQGYEVTLPVVVDVENISYDEARADELDKETRTDVTLAFLDEVEKSGYKPMLYTGLLVYFHYLDQSRIWQYPLWYAFYTENLYFPYKISCWQYTDSASVQGIKGNVDMSIWFVDPESL